MTTRTDSLTNAKRLAQMKFALAEILTEATKRGFFRTVGIELSVQDGTIQAVRRRVERVEK